MLLRAILLGCLALSSPLHAQEGPRAPAHPRTELRVDPVVIGDARPRFSWEVDDPRRGAAQSAWRVLVSQNLQSLQSEKGEEWDSGQVAGPETCQVEYGGRPLTPGRTYYWTVRTWDAQGKPSPWSTPAQFGVAPLAPGDWRARWVRAGRAPAAAAIGWHSAFAKAEDDWQWVQLDLGGDVICDRVRLHPARPDGDLSKPGVLFPLKVRVYTDSTGKFDGNKFIRIAEYEWQDIPGDGSEPLELAFSRYTLRYLRIVVTKMRQQEGRGFAAALGEIEVLDGTTNIASRGKVTAGSTLDEDGWRPEAINDGALVPAAQAAAAAEDALPRLRTSFTLDALPSRAWMHATALGACEVTVNGVRIGDERLAPGWTDYARRVPYQSHEVSAQLRQGQNVIGVQLAPGWYAGRLGLADLAGGGKVRGFYGEEPCFLAQLDIVLENGKRVLVQTDDTWRSHRAGPVLTADLLDGETRDSTREETGWDAPQFQAADWRPVAIVDGPGPELFVPAADPMRVTDVRPALSMHEAAPGVFLYDFGQNVVGVVRLKAAGDRGTEIVVQHGEVLDATGQLYLGNLRGAAQLDRYVLRGGLEVLEPRFTLHGFRYVIVAGLSRALPLADVEALVIGTDLRAAGTFDCSDPLLNQLWRNAAWSIRGNCAAIPTNCAQRDERLGWLGDVQAVTPTLLHLHDAAGFLTQWLADVRGAQSDDGRFPDFAPHPFASDQRFRGAPGWADAGVLVPWELWRRTHDRRLLAASAEPARRWVRFVAGKNPDLVWRKDRGMDYGDWRNAGTIKAEGYHCADCKVPKDLFATAFFARSAEVAARLSAANGEAEQARELGATADRARAAFRKEFVEPVGRLRGDTQAGYALALDLELHETPEQATQWADRLAQRVEEQGALTCGFPTAHRALLALSRHGHHALAVDLATRRTLPSWGFMVEQGATTMWERWDGLLPDRAIEEQDVNSLNSLALSSLGQWMVEALAGIVPGEPEEDATARPSAWRAFRLEPRLGGGLTHARAEHHSIVGRIASAWRLQGKELTYECTVPPNTSAVLVLPAAREGLTESGKPVAEAAGVTVLAGDDGAATRIQLQAGAYVFRGRALSGS